MPLHVPPAPAPALRSVLAALGSPAAVREARTPALRAAPGPLAPEGALPVHVLDMTDAGAPPAEVASAPLTGWRFQIRAGDRTVAAADTVLTADGWAFSHFFEGPYLAATERALLSADLLGSTYQPRLLSVPGLYMLMLWLHADTTAVPGDPAADRSAAGDLLVPLAPAPPGIAAHLPHTPAELLPVLRHRLRPVSAPAGGAARSGAPLLGTTA